MEWNKKGFLFKPDATKWWMLTHAMIPTAEKISEDQYKIYFSGRDNQNRSQIGYFILDLKNGAKVTAISDEPVLSPGRLGTFDDNGVSPASIVKDGNTTYLYYIGWNPGSTTRMHIYGGLAFSEDGGKTFKRWSEAPIIERNRVNPFINTAPFAIKASENQWFLYYVSGVEWVNKDLPRYNIQMAESTDGKNWKREGHVCMDFEGEENALARPYVIKENGIYKMWFASKGETYSMKYAESNDGRNWTRKPMKFDGVAPGGGDEHMAEYGIVIESHGKKYMLYNGNDYGKDGILYAILE